MTLAYIVSRFPVVTETFILREIQSLEHMGWPVELFALRHMPRGVMQTAARQREPYVHFPQSQLTVRHMLWLARRHPDAAQRLIRMTVAGYQSSPRALAKALLAVPMAVAWAAQMRTLHIHHVHAHFGSYATLAALVAAELAGISFSFTVHAHDLFADNQMLAEKARRARFVVAISEFNRRRLTALIGPDPACRVRVIHCGVDIDAFAFVRPRPKGPPYRLLSVAALREYKGLHHLVAACGMLRSRKPDIAFVCHILGEGPERTSLQRQIAARGLESFVRLEGATDESMVRTFLARADTFVMPSVVAHNGFMDGIPVALMEAMACGVPVIASRLSGIPELIRDSETGVLVPPGSPEALFEAILGTWSEPAAAARRARRARMVVERDYNLRVTTHQLATAFTELTARAVSSISRV